MEKNRKRAIRRHHRARIIARRYNGYARWMWAKPADFHRNPRTGEMTCGSMWENAEGKTVPGPLTWDEVEFARWRIAARIVNTPTPCSCHMCGNPRKWFNEPTRGEILADIWAAEQLDDFIKEIN